MQFSAKTLTAGAQRTGGAAVGVFESHKLSDAARALDKLSKGYLSNVLKGSNFEGKLGETLLLYTVPGSQADAVLLVGMGQEDKLDLQGYRKANAKAAAALAAAGIKEAVSFLPQVTCKNLDSYWKTRHAVEATEDALYRFDQLKSKPDRPRNQLGKLTLAAGDTAELKRATQAVTHGEAVAAGVSLAKDLSNLPGNICTPAYLAQEARKLAKEFPKIKTTVLDEAQMAKLGMGALLAVARGSRQPAKLIVMEYKGGKEGQRPHALVGKGLTFDTGGISIKPSLQMDEMKFDMCGGASVLGAMKTIAMLGLKMNVVGVVPSSENMPDGDANKPGDIVTSMSGQTIEVLNTDAEGRLILCDALTYTERFKPETVLDIATLTGAIVIALGNHPTGVFTQDNKLAGTLLEAADLSGDRAWRMPLWDDYQEQLKSNFADMTNVGGREGGAITAACFLARYTKKFRWAHLDVAGTAWLSGPNKGATGRPVPLLVQYLLNQA